jgi:acyl carrier protein
MSVARAYFFCRAAQLNQQSAREFSMPDKQALTQQVFDEIAALVTTQSIEVTAQTPLLGDGSVLDSMKLVELCITLEDLAADLDFDFDWTSEAAMSRSRGMFRTAGALADEFLAQVPQ